MSEDAKQKTVILLAEDDENDVLLFRRAIHAAGIPYDIKAVSDGEQAIRYLQREGHFCDTEAFPLPRFLILDLKMPRKNGFDVLQWLLDHPECKVIPTIAFSSSNLASDIKRAYELGANTYFTKPNDYAELKNIFQTIAAYWSKANLPPIPKDDRCA